MKTLKAGLFTVLMVVLAACSSVPPSPELQAGVDEFGAYTVILEEGLSGTTSDAADELQTQDTLSTSGGSIRTVQLRKYSGNRYGTWLNIESKNTTVNWKGILTVRFIGGGTSAKDRTLSTRTYLGKWETWGGNTGALSPDRSNLDTVCAMVDGYFSSKNGSRGFESSDTYFSACKDV